MKIFDKFLKLLKTDRNTFLTYVLALGSVYVLVDRIVEFILIVFTGVASRYWGPISYAIAFAFPIFTFLFSMSSKFISCDDDKIFWFKSYCISLYILGVTMLVEWFNKLVWLGLISLPGYDVIVSQFSYLIKPALSSIALVLPLLSWHWLFNQLYVKFNKDKKDSLFDYEGLNLSDTSIGWGPYTNEVFLGMDKDHGNSVKIPEIRRYESTLVVGISGAGKTSLIFEPWVAQDIDKKFFYKESSKTLAFAALKSGIATLNCPYDNDYINKNFNLNMLVPVENKKKLYKSYLSKFIYAESGSSIYYRNLGITYVAPEDETINRVKSICENFGMSYNLVDPNDSNSVGLNPFSFDNPVQTALSISTILKGFYEENKLDISMFYYNAELTNQIIENLAVLLKVTYPKLNNGKLPNLEDMYKLLNNFSLIEKMCKIIENDANLAETYQNQLNYFKKNFYDNSPNRAQMEKLVAYPISQLDNLLRYPGVKKILCNRSNNMNFDNALLNGDITLVCTRRGDLGENAHKLFGLFFLLLMQFSVLRRAGNENTRLPHFLYIDEFPDFICPAIEPIFTIYRKYRVATVISAQNLSQLNAKGEKIGNTIIANCANKIVFGGNTPEDNEWWGKELGEKKEWTYSMVKYDQSKGKYDSSFSPKYENKQKYSPGKIQSLKFKKCAYKVKGIKGDIVNGTANLDFLPSKFKEKQKIKEYNFTKYSSGVNEDSNTSKNTIRKSKVNDDINYNPIRSTSSRFDDNNAEAITFVFKNNKKRKKENA